MCLQKNGKNAVDSQNTYLNVLKDVSTDTKTTYKKKIIKRNAAFFDHSKRKNNKKKFEHLKTGQICGRRDFRKERRKKTKRENGWRFFKNQCKMSALELMYVVGDHMM